MIRITGRSGGLVMTLLFHPQGPRESMRFQRHRERLSWRLMGLFPDAWPVVHMNRSDMERIYLPSRRCGQTMAMADEMFNSIRDAAALTADPIMEIKDLRPKKPWYRHKERW